MRAMVRPNCSGGRRIVHHKNAMNPAYASSRPAEIRIRTRLEGTIISMTDMI